MATEWDRRRAMPHSPVLAGGDGTALRGEGTGDGVSKANAAVPNPLGIWHWPGPSQLPDPC